MLTPDASILLLLSSLEWHVGFGKVSIGLLIRKWHELTGTSFPFEDEGFGVVIFFLSSIEGIVFYDHFFVKLWDHRYAEGETIHFEDRKEPW